MRALMMGRFQPFHLGHLSLVKQLLEENDEIIIALTSSQFNYLEKDPFTAGERIEMIHNSLRDENIDLSKSFIVAIENQFNIATWASYLQSALPKFDRVYSGNEYVKMLLADFGIDVVVPSFLEREKYNATRIREMMVKDEDWQSHVPKAVSEIIQRINGIRRIKIISQTDTKPTEH
ncbi:MAG: nicotinamide-nucleotide adenylyltransferase [Nitrosopumilaceae archaeon]|nr:nicotinamide-nucleotide adenylyltransferase [Nitrosopumilaceae archaeon]NIU01543.1 nicotinamide-nucleotide adenylyltransferase [Nitrosopumilaceae archaeon]NIU87962.1 nicotinamide-nucleotide adenylyltransferase [Nitrosopumilaceae archaeon]NIV66234.1 nicotinamide-nucleotide adenylyltransferase [Nitrosopumilaceae archaeon]NIX62145.1 nicotinamide-nucleotide adenylyltransferase [Nitrosopumilaceae archaeon]